MNLFWTEVNNWVKSEANWAKSEVNRFNFKNNQVKFELNEVQYVVNWVKSKVKRSNRVQLKVHLVQSHAYFTLSPLEPFPTPLEGIRASLPYIFEQFSL